MTLESLKASRALSYQIRPASIRGATARVDQVAPPAGDPGAPPPQSHTLASLGGGDETFYGTRQQERTYSFTLPPGWKLTGPSVLTLRFSHASTLDPEQSVIDVRLNDQPVGSTFLDARQCQRRPVDGSPLAAHPPGWRKPPAHRAGNDPPRSGRSGPLPAVGRQAPVDRAQPRLTDLGALYHRRSKARSESTCPIPLARIPARAKPCSCCPTDTMPP